MKYNQFVRFLCSIPVVLVFIYFIPFLGICLLFMRCFVYNNKKTTPIILISVAAIILIPKGLNSIFDLAHLDKESIPYFNDVINSDLYNSRFINYSKTLFTVGIIYLILSLMLKALFNKVGSRVSNGIRDYINESEKREAEISQKNDMEIKIKQEKVKNTSYVKCPNCGSDNLLEEKYGTCKYCRSKLVNKN